MNELEVITFREIKQKKKYDIDYSYFLNILVKSRKDKGCTTRFMAKVFNCSAATISNFENRVKDFDFVMLYKYAGFLKYNLTMHLSKMSYREIMDN